MIEIYCVCFTKTTVFKSTKFIWKKKKCGISYVVYISQTEYKYEVTVNEGEDNDDYPNVNYATENTEYVKCENGCLSSMDISNGMHSNNINIVFNSSYKLVRY